MTFCVDGALTEPLAGTAPHRRVWALVEHPGPWGREAVVDAPWPTLPSGESFGQRLAALTDAADVRVVLARRPDRAGREGHGDGDADGPTTVVLAAARHPSDGGGWIGTTTLPRRTDLLDLDWAGAAAAAGRPDGWSDPGPVWGVCTHGTRDACCARLGRPLAQAFAQVCPDGTWEISHSGGHRFAGVAFAVAEGLLYGRVGPDDVDALEKARADGVLVRDRLRGAVYRTPAQQAAEAALREHLAQDRLDAVVHLDGDAASRWQADGGTWRVDVVQQAIPDRPASCGKPAEPASAWVATGVHRQG